MNPKKFLDGMRRMGGTLALALGMLVVAQAAQGQPSSVTPVPSRRDALGMEFVRVPAGSFLMGSPSVEAGRHDDEFLHEVRVSKGFWMGRHEVTQGQWVAVMGENPSHFLECGARCPVERVSWEAVQEFIRRLNELEAESGYRYRLPTEAEWEYAARAGTSGARYGELEEIAWFGANSGGTTHPVGLKQANGWGLHDMLGNIWEWTADWYAWSPGALANRSVGFRDWYANWYERYPAEPVTDPQGWYWGEYRVNRGGGWSSDAKLVRSANRSLNPGHRLYSIGFRLVRAELTEPTQLPELPEWRNTLGTEFVRIPAGSFQMGSPETVPSRDSREDQHEVRISEGFWLGKYEVTQREWEALMGSTPAQSPNPDCRERMCPIIVSWEDAQEFICRLNDWEAKSGYRYRLPTAAEWEYAARAGTAEYDYGELRGLAWTGAFRVGKPRPVGLKQANAWGLHDMLGNVLEWTGDVNYHVYQTALVRGVVVGRAGLSPFPLLEFSLRLPTDAKDVGFRLVRTE